MSEPRFYQSVSRISRPAGTPEDAWDLFCAAAEGHLPTIRELIDQDRELIHYQIWYEFPLHFAVRGGHVDAVKLLLEAGTNPSWSNFNYSSWQKLLPIAEERGHPEIHDVLVAEMKRRFNYDPSYKPLFAAIGEQTDVEKACRIIDEQPELIDVGDEHGSRPLHWAVMARRLPVIEKLLDAEADIQARRADLQTPLHLSILGGDYWFRKADDSDPNTELAAVTDLLLDRGAEYEFSVAVARGDRQRVEEILAENPEAATLLNESRRSPLGIAAFKNQIDMVRLLLERGADPNTPEECSGRGAALFQACGRNDVEMVKLLLEHGADPNAEVDSSGCCLTIAEYRKTEDTPDVQRLLREHGAVDPLWQLDTPGQIRERLQSDPTLTHDDSYWGGILGRVIAMADIALLHDFISRFGDEPIHTIDPANGWNVVDDPVFLDELISLGMDVNRPDWYGQTYLHTCVAEEKEHAIETARLYLDRGIGINAVDFVNGKTPLGVAKMNGNKGMATFLVERGATE